MFSSVLWILEYFQILGQRGGEFSTRPEGGWKRVAKGGGAKICQLTQILCFAVFLWVLGYFQISGQRVGENFSTAPEGGGAKNCQSSIFLESCANKVICKSYKDFRRMSPPQARNNESSLNIEEYIHKSVHSVTCYVQMLYIGVPTRSSMLCIKS